jgi:hypothetical protein
MKMARKCIFCGNLYGMEKRIGTFNFTPPDNIPGGVFSIPDSMWEECSECHEILIPHDLSISLEKEAERRRK